MTKIGAFFGITTIVLVAVTVYLLFPQISLPKISLSPTASGAPAAVKSTGSSGYHSVFLSNGQVYFGRLSGFSGREPVLKEVYYLKVGTIPVATAKVDEKTGGEASISAAPAPATSAPATKSTFILARLSDEIHGPQDEMRFNKDQILYIEELRPDSKIVDAIKRSQEAEKVKK